MAGWITYGAHVHGWPPDTMRRQRVGDLHTILDADLARLERMKR